MFYPQSINISLSLQFSTKTAAVEPIFGTKVSGTESTRSQELLSGGSATRDPR